MYSAVTLFSLIPHTVDSDIERRKMVIVLESDNRFLEVSYEMSSIKRRNGRPPRNVLHSG